MRLRAHPHLALGALLLLGGTAASQAAVQPAAAPVTAPVTAPVVAPAAAPAAASEPAFSPAERGALELLRSLRRKERPPDEELATRLAEPGEQLLPVLFEVLAKRIVPAPDPVKPDQAKPEAPQVLSEVQENIVLLALGKLERDAVLAQVNAVTLADPSPAHRAAGVACIGAAGRSNDLPQMFELALGRDEKSPGKLLEATLRRAVTTLLARDPRTIEQLTNLRRVTRPELLPALVEAVGASKDPHGLAYLSEVAYWHDGLVLDVMSQVPLLGPSGDEAIDGSMRVRLRPYLDELRPGPCRAAIMALTALKDLDSIETLIGLLDSENEGLRETAHWGLKQLTGLTLAATPVAWSNWHQGELYWLLREKPREFQRLKDPAAAVVADALRTVLEHPLARKELCAAVPDLLKSPYPGIRVLACRTLSELGAKDAVPKLVWALEDSVPDVSHAAHAALRKLTRLDLPCESLAWQSATNTAPRGTEL